MTHFRHHKPSQQGGPALDQAGDLIGRRTELGELAAALERWRGGQPVTHLVEVTGDAGIGKTAVLSAFTGMARSADAVVLSGRAVRGAHDVPFSTFADAFDDNHELVRAAMTSGHPAQHGELCAIFPAMADGENHPGQRVGHRDQHAVRELLEQLAARGLMLIMDDFHDVDPASLELMSGMLRRPLKAPVLFVLGYRDRQASTELRSAIDGRSQLVHRKTIRLGPLSEQDTDEMLRGHGTVSSRRKLYQDSGGNPSYLKALVSEQPLYPARHDPLCAGQGPSAHYAPFLGELEAVSPSARTVADAAAVVGNEFEVELVARMLEQPESVVLEGIGELIARDVVRPVGYGHYFAFRHPLVHRAVYSGSELSRRVQLHVRADDVLRARGVSATERAPHVEQWAKHGDLDVVEVMDTAAKAITATEPNTAAAWLTTALRVLPRDPRFHDQRSDLLVRLAKARGAAGHLRECRDTMHEALRIMPKQPPSDHARAVAFTAMVQRLLGAQAETDAMLRAEIDVISENTVACAALKFELAAGKLKNGDSAACWEWANVALSTARRHQDRCLQVACLGLMAKAGAVDGHTESAADYLAQANAILDGMLDSEFAACLEVVEWIAWSEVVLERWDDALRHFAKGVEFASRADHRLTLPHLLVGKVFVLRTQGKLTEAQAAAEHAVDLAQQSGSPEQLVSAHSMQSWTDTILGRLDRAVENGLIATEQTRDTVAGWRDALALRILAEAKLMTGDHEGCLALVGAVGGPDLPTASVYTRVAWYELLTRAELAASRPDLAAKWAESATACAALLDQPGRTGLAQLARAQVLLAQNPESALSCAQQAHDCLEAAGMTVDTLRAKVSLGVALWHQDNYDEAVRELKHAQLAFEQLGAVPLARLARTERRRLAARVTRAKNAGNDRLPPTLTSREQQVADLVREGLTNRMISKRLHISEKTVEMHLSNVFAKLGVSNRAAVAAFLSRERSGTAGRSGQH